VSSSLQSRIPLKRFAQVMPSNVDKHSVEGEAAVRLCNYVDVYKNQRITACIDFMQATASEAQIDRFTLKSQDVIVTKDSEEPTDIGIPAYVPLDLPGVICGYHLAVLRPDRERLYGGFLHWALQSAEVAAYYSAAATGISRYALSISDMAMTPLRVPRMDEQERIANFLDDKTARIDALIAEKERLVERLAEYRQSLATTAVTQGVPGTHTEFIEHPFLGAIPAVWRAGKFRHYVQIRSGQVDPEDDKYSSMTLIAPNHIESGSGRLLGTETATEQAAESGKYWCDAGDVIYSKIRPALRKATIAPFDCLCSADMYPLKGQMGLANEFLFWYLLSEPFSDFAVQESMRVAMPKLNRETLATAVIPLPAPDEQHAIVSYIKKMVAALDPVTEHAVEHIARLREYRSSLISAAVTGQLNLRTFKAVE
jgi:type I restriction enzyme, S subunit